MWPNSSSPSFPTKAALPPILVTAMATLAGAPPGALRNPGASARETPDTVGTKSMSISPKLTMRPFPVGVAEPLVIGAICFELNDGRTD
ncbi:hypothetical protein MLD38_023851 [Melastoma candidum]|uniref:Uncharacterized protein n=1 Tax=Melastoma candidum TaxID=119954 RepID=A0ACB9NQW0_9MYRT|nr:hypothetical protein MLD38_023851 [Melastoma candidum]